MADLRLHLLGSPRIVRTGVEVPVSRRKTMALLAYLAITRARHNRDELAELLYPRADRQRARAGLRLCLHGLRASLGPRYLAIGRAVVELVMDPGLWFDLREARRLASPRDEVNETHRLVAAAALYRNELMKGFYLTDSPTFEAWQHGEQEKVRVERARLLERLTDLCEQQGRLAAAADYARERLEIDSLDEVAQRRLIALLAAGGNRAAALREYARCRGLLADELGVEPDHATQELYLTIASAGSSPASVGPRRPAHTGNLPVPSAPFIGRSAELDATVRALEGTRLLTLTGAGGIGKTRLAIEAARTMEGRFDDGAWFVDLSGLRDPSHIATVIADALGIREAEGGTQSLEGPVLSYLKGRRLLLLLDTFEHVVSGAAIVARMLAECPGVTSIVTSRRRLGLRAERELTLPPMGLPASDDHGVIAGSDSVRLFVHHAVAARPTFAFTPRNAARVAAICTSLDGLPLAIELAASRLRDLTLDEIHDGLSRRFDLLRAGPGDPPNRRRDLEANLDWSLSQLDAGERGLFEQLSVFPAGWTREAAEAVCGGEGGMSAAETADGLATLVDHSLVVLEHQCGRDRYRMLDSLREYGASGLNSAAAGNLRARLASYYIELAERAEPPLRGSLQRLWFARLDAEGGSYRALLSWLAEQERYEDGARLAGALGWYWFRRGRFREARGWLTLFGDRMTPHLPAVYRARLAFHLAWNLSATGRVHIRSMEAATAFRRSCELSREAGDPRLEALSLACLGWQLWTVAVNPAKPPGDPSEPISLSRASVALARKIGDPWITAFCLRHRLPGYASDARVTPNAHPYRIDIAGLERDMEEAVALARSTEDGFLLCMCIKGMGDVSDPDPWWLDSLTIAREMDDPWSMFETLKWLPGWYLRAGHLEQARALYGEGLRLAASLGAAGYLPWFVGGFDYIARHEGRPIRAARLWAAAAALAEGHARPCVPGVQDDLGLDDETAARAWGEGQAMGFDRVMAYALSDAEDPD